MGATGWSGGVSYTFRFVFDSTQLQVYVNDVLELDISGSFANGRMGFYNFSQAAVTYSAFTLDCPSLAENYGDGWPGTLGVPALTASADPVLGTTIQLHAGNAYGGETVGCLFIGLAPAALPTPYDGVVLVAITGLVSLHPLPIGGTDLAFTIPSDIAYCGIDLYAQLVHGDPGATQGLAFSQGLHMILGQ